MGPADEVNLTLERHFGVSVDAVAVSGSYAYIGQGLDFVVLDVNNPAVKPIMAERFYFWHIL